jgi:hypothetical protein
MLHLENILVTQEWLRNAVQINGMVYHLINGGTFDSDAICKFSKRQAGLIQIARFPDGKLFLQDGHHRLMAVFLSRRDFLHSFEYEITDWTYQEYLDINFKQKWVTPYDPRTELRIEDYHSFKCGVFERYAVSEEDAIQYINENRDKYTIKRSDVGITDIASMARHAWSY